MSETNRSTDFYLSTMILILTIVLSIVTFNRWINLRFKVGDFYITHIMAWIGAIYVGLYTPFYYTIKRRNPRSIKPLINLHTLGNLLSFMLVSIHLAQQLGRPAQFYPELGTGVALFVVMFLLVVTGYLHRYQLFPAGMKVSGDIPHTNRYVHVALTLGLYVILVVHILRNTGMM